MSTNKENIIRAIGRHKYAHLQTLNKEQLTDVDKHQISEYEKIMGINQASTYHKPEPKPFVDGLEFNKQNLWTEFEKAFFDNESKRFERDKASLDNLKPIFEYFAGDADFYKNQNVKTRVLGTDLKPSLQKGLLIIGEPGNGKTAIMNAFRKLFYDAYLRSGEERWKSAMDWRARYFLSRTTIQVSSEFENLQNYEKDDFFKSYSKGVYFFDDFGREHVANNYGKKDVFADILFERHRIKSKTYLTMNYLSNDGSLENTLIAIGERYGSHIFDRFFEMFNIIEFKGKSFRK